MTKKKPAKKNFDEHDELVQTAKDAITEVHSDISVDLHKTLSSLEELQLDLESCIAAVREDIDNDDPEEEELSEDE